MKLNSQALLAAGLFALALVLRLMGIGWGLKNDLHNQSYHPDEALIWAQSQKLDPAHLSLTPGFYNYGTLYLSVLKVASDMTAAYTGAPDPKSEDSVWSFVARCNLAGRIVSAIAGAGTVLMLFLLMRRFAGPLGGAMAAAALLIAPGHVVHSRFQTVDVFATFLLAVSAYFALRLIPIEGETIEEKAAMRWVLLSAIFTGLSAGTKYTGVLGLLTLFVVLFACRRSRLIREGALAIVAALVAFVVATPGVVLDFQKFKTDVGFEMSHTSEGHGLVFAGTSSGYVYHLGNLVTGIGLVILLMGLGGLLYAAYRKRVWAVALLALFVPYYLMIGGATDKYLRYTFPLYIAVAAGFGYAMSAGHRRKGLGLGVVMLGIAGLGGILDARGLTATLRYTAWMMGADPRDDAARYMKEEAKANPNLTVGLASDPWYWTAPLFPNSTSLRGNPAKLQEEMRAASAPRIAFYVPTDAPPHPFDTRLLTELQPDEVTMSSLETAAPDRLAQLSGLTGPAQATADQYRSFTNLLKSTYGEDRSFGSVGDQVEDMMYIHPMVWVWKKK